MTTAAGLTKPKTAHLFLTHDGEHGVSAESPQLPGFVFLRQTSAEARRDLPGALRFAGHRGPVRVHHVQRFVSPEGVDYAVRVADDERVQDRLQTTQVLHRVLTDRQNRRELLDEGHRDPLGDVIFVAVLAADRLSWIFDQMDERGDMINLAFAVTDVGALFVSPLAGQQEAPVPGWASLEAYGLSADSTVSDLVRALSAEDPDSPVEGTVRRSRGLLVPA